LNFLNCGHRLTLIIFHKNVMGKFSLELLRRDYGHPAAF